MSEVTIQMPGDTADHFDMFTTKGEAEKWARGYIKNLRARGIRVTGNTKEGWVTRPGGVMVNVARVDE